MEKRTIKALIGLGNPGERFKGTRHNIGFHILDVLAEQHQVLWQTKDNMDIAECQLNNQKIFLIKPLTFMNNSGAIVAHLKQMGIQSHEIVIIHDELELPFCKVSFKQGGSAKGHNGLRSFISFIGDNFLRLRFGIGRPEHQEEVSQYVLQVFSSYEKEKLHYCIAQAINMLKSLFI